MMEVKTRKTLDGALEKIIAEIENGKFWGEFLTDRALGWDCMTKSISQSKELKLLGGRIKGLQWICPKNSRAYKIAEFAKCRYLILRMGNGQVVFLRQSGGGLTPKGKRNNCHGEICALKNIPVPVTRQFVTQILDCLQEDIQKIVQKRRGW